MTEEKNTPKKNEKEIKHFKRFAREWTMQFLFQNDINSSEDIHKASELFYSQLEDKEAHRNVPDEKTFCKALKSTKELIEGVIANLEAIDKKIASFSAKWTIDRMNTVDRNIMRIATYEMLFCKNVPPVVSINEAVEIGKTFGTVNSAAFINGILNSIKDTLDRPARKAINE